MSYPDYRSSSPSRAPSVGFAVTSLVTGIVGLLILPIVLGPLAIIFGGLGMSHARESGAGNGMAIAGLVLGIIQVVVLFARLASI